MLTDFLKEKILTGKAHTEGFMHGDKALFDAIEIRPSVLGNYTISLLRKEKTVLTFAGQHSLESGDVLTLRGLYGGVKVDLT